MDLKKSPKADLENKKGIFFQIGLVVVLAIIHGVFEWTSSSGGENTLGELTGVEIEEEIIPITRQDEIKPPPPPPPTIVEVINIVEDDVEVEDDAEIDDAESDQNTEVEIIEIAAEEPVEEEEVFMFAVIEDKPEFPGGEVELRKYLAKSTVYPVIARENNIEGKVYVSFVISKDGSVTDVKILRGVDPLLDKESLRVVQSMPKWTPGKQRGKPVKVQYQVPMVFKLN